MRQTVLAAVFALYLFSGPLRAADDPKEKIPPPEELVLRTGDGVTIAATYYASPSKQGRQVVPIILLHAAKGSRGDFVPLAYKLQQAKHAVVVPDLRGHGDSSRPEGHVGELRPADYQAMADRGGDLEAVKRFYLERNNAGEVNIEKLCLVGAEMGAAVAVNWARYDWDWPQLATGKQGQDVKGLVLVSPEWSFKGLRIHDAVAHPGVREELSVMIIAGRGNSRLEKEARRLHSAFEKFHPPPASDAEADRQTLWLRTPQTSLQGTKLINEKSMNVDEMILKFVELRLVRQQIPWSERKNPLN